MPDESDRGVPFAAIKAAMDKNLSGVLRETTPTFAEALSNFQANYGRYGGRRGFARSTGLPESTLRRWEKQIAAGTTPVISETNKERLRSGVRKVERIIRLSTATEEKLRTNMHVRIQAVFTGQVDRGERTLFLHHTTEDKKGFEKAAKKLVSAYIRGSKRDCMEALDDMLEAYDPDNEAYFSVDSFASLTIS